MRRWTAARQRRVMQLACFGAALGFPGYLIATEQADKVNPYVVALVGLFLTAAGLLTSPTRHTRGPADDRQQPPDDDGPDDDIDSLAALLDRLRKVAGPVDRPEDHLRMVAIG